MGEVHAGALRAVPAFASAPELALTDLTSRARSTELAPGDVLLRRGEPSDDVHVVLDGALTVEIDEGGDAGPSVVAELGSGAVVGEVAALTGGARTATVIARSPSHVLQVPRDAFTDLLDAAPEVGEALATIAHQRLRANRLLGSLIALFPDLPHDAIELLTASVEWVRLRAGQTLFEEGEPTDAAYISLSGRLRATRHLDAGAEIVGEISRGELVGEQALLEDGVRTATITATRDAELARLPRTMFEELARDHPSAMLHLARVALERVRDPPPLTASAESVLAVVPGDEGTAVSELLDAVIPILQRYGSVARVSSASADAALRRDGIANAPDDSPAALRLTRWLEELEDQHDLVVLEADPRPGVWTRRVVGLAEHLVIVADATAHPEPQGVERWLAEPGVVSQLPRRSLVLLHPAHVELPRGTAAWLDARQVDRHHHVRGMRDGDVGRLGRHLAGEAVGVALSGGGARGFAHVGAIRALRQRHIPIDVVAGVSMGCAIGVIVALDHRHHEDLVANVRDAFHRPLDYTLPVSGLITGKRITAAVERIFGDRTLEDLPIPFLGISTDLTRSEVAVHRRGDIRRVVRASVAIPGVIPPLVIDGSLHVDGGVLDNLPMQAARDEVRSGTLVAIDVTPADGPDAPADFGMSISGWRHLFDRLVPGRHPTEVPRLATTAMRAMLAASTRHRDAALAAGLPDLYVHVGELPCGLLDFDALDRVAEAGYAAAIDPGGRFASVMAGGADV